MIAFALTLLAEAFACCVAANELSSCRVLANVHDASACKPATEWALCQVDGASVLECEPVSLYCCAETSGVAWLDACEQYVPGTKCGGAVVTQ